MRGLGLLLLLLVLPQGCASGGNTPRQEYVYDMAKGCESADGVLGEVQANGQFMVWGPAADLVLRCIRENMQRRSFVEWERQRTRGR